MSPAQLDFSGNTLANMLRGVSPRWFQVQSSGKWTLTSPVAQLCLLAPPSEPRDHVLLWEADQGRWIANANKQTNKTTWQPHQYLVKTNLRRSYRLSLFSARGRNGWRFSQEPWQGRALPLPTPFLCLKYSGKDYSGFSALWVPATSLYFAQSIYMG